jgi:hypothetical protein
MKKTIFIVGAICVSQVGCAMIFGEGTQRIQIEPSSGKEVKTRIETPDGNFEKTIPTEMTISKSSFDDVQVTVIDECYEPTTTAIEKDVEPVFWLDLIFLNPFFAIGDWLSGYMWEYRGTTVINTVEKDVETDCSNQEISQQKLRNSRLSPQS